MNKIKMNKINWYIFTTLTISTNLALTYTFSNFEKVVVRRFLYPVLTHKSTRHLFQDQFAYKPTGSTTAAVICLLHRISELLLTNPFVHLIALDFSKAFDTVRHSTMMGKFSNFPFPIMCTTGLSTS